MRRVLNLALVGLALAGCSGTKSDTGDGTSTDGGSADGGSTADGGGEDTAPPDTQDWCGVQEIFDAKCTACHAGGSPAGRLDLYTDAHAAIVGVESALYPSYILVVPGSPEQSFLLAKVENTHDPDTEGDAMPPNNGLDAERASIVRQWILDGATSDCDPEEDGGSSGDGGSVESYHPAGYGEPTVHGMEAKLADQVCADCHGADLRGSGEAPSCDDCHETDDPDGWRGDCTFCHGGVQPATHGAPPESIRDELTDTAYGQHTSHVTASNHGPYDCTTCHVKPEDALSAGHLWDGTAGIAEVVFTEGLSPAGTWSTTAKSCANLYCHGDGKATSTGDVDVSDAPLSCSSCHPDSRSSSDAWEGMSGRHKHHLEAGIGCQDCHVDTVSRDGAIVDANLHVDGTRDVSIEHADTMTWSPISQTCDGVCHSERHSSRTWVK